MNNEKNVANLVCEVGNSNLNKDIQENLIGSLLNSNRPEGEDATLDKFFGKRNAQIYISLIMSIILLAVVLVLTCIFREDKELVKFFWNLAIPAFTLLWGYAFGKNQS